MKTIVKLGYTIDELDKAAKARALDKFRYINVESDWWDFDGLTGFSTKEGKLYGFKTMDDYNDLLVYERIFFDIGRGEYLQFVEPRFRDLEQARRFLGIDKRLWARAQYAYYFDVTGRRDGDTVLKWNDPNYFELGKTAKIEWTKKELEQLERARERFDDKRKDCLRILRDEYEGATSDEAVEETLQANDYYFDSAGKRIE